MVMLGGLSVQHLGCRICWIAMKFVTDIPDPQRTNYNHLNHSLTFHVVSSSSHNAHLSQTVS